MARRKTFRRGSARIRAETRGFRPVPRGSAELPPKIFSRGLRRTSGERSADSAGLRAETGESARSPPRTGGRVHSKNVRRQKLILRHRSWRKIFRTGRPSAADDSAADVSAADDSAAYVSAADYSAAETSADTIEYLYYWHCKNFRRDVVLIFTIQM